MTKTAAVMFAPGFEEIEGLTQVDVLRRAGVQVTMVGLEDRMVTGGHGITVTCDAVLGDHLLDYDVVIFPGGMGGATALRDSNQLMALMKQRHANGKWNAAMCAAPMALGRYGLLDGRTYTSYPEIETHAQDGHFTEDITVVDQEGKIITSRGPATALAFAYRILGVLGVDAQDVRHAMLYDYLKDNIQ